MNEGWTSPQRILVLFTVFEKVRAVSPENLSKIHTIEGNLSKKELGLNEKDKEILRNEVNIVFHCGASLNMDSNLEEAVITNVRGTSAVLDLIKHAKQLRSFILVSTAYSNCYQSHIEEKFYEPTICPELLVRITEELQPDVLKDISHGLIGKWPNSYVFTKAIAENLLTSRGQGLPVALFRPTIVTSTAYEPLPGWSDNLYGPLGILLSSHCGILRVIQANGAIKSHTVPGDMCINALLCLAWDVDKKW
ncbi:hypothetical protein JTB14_006487 [Gonioctena quinquepunctata]|nr:hypothetical protein JTB14_006487 [Gonioctena quinquepunctata]